MNGIKNKRLSSIKRDGQIIAYVFGRKINTGKTWAKSLDYKKTVFRSKSTSMITSHRWRNRVSRLCKRSMTFTNALFQRPGIIGFP